jgi:hypothetical protein
MAAMIKKTCSSIVLAALLPVLIAAQATLRPTERPLVTADNERWYLDGAPIFFAGSLYYPAGPQVFFNQNEMVRSGNYQGIPLYSQTTIEAFSVVFVPLSGGLMQPYERRRAGDMAGTVGNTVPSFPVDRDSQVVGDIGIQAAAAPGQSDAYTPYVDARDDSRAVPRVAGTTGTEAPARPVGPLRTARTPTGLNAFFIEYQGQRWVSSGPAVVLDRARLTRSGDYRGFPVYADEHRGDTIYVAVARAAEGLVTPYVRR